jgi:hypothetical protein
VKREVDNIARGTSYGGSGADRCRFDQRTDIQLSQGIGTMHFDRARADR